MNATTPLEITQLLIAWNQGDEVALEKLAPHIYAELHRLAHSYMRREKPGHLLQTTALINETYLKLIDFQEVSWQSRAQFFGVAANLMRRILVDFARSQNFAKRGGGALRVPFDEAIGAIDQRSVDLGALDDALTGLEKLSPRQARVVELRFFGGLTNEEAALATGASPHTVRRDWELARAWLHRELSRDAGHVS